MTRPEPDPTTIRLDWTRFGSRDDQHYEVQVTDSTVTVMSECCTSSMSDETIVKLFGALANHPAVVRHCQLAAADAIVKMHAVGLSMTFSREDARRLFGIETDTPAIEVTAVASTEGRRRFLDAVALDWDGTTGTVEAEPVEIVSADELAEQAAKVARLSALFNSDGP